MTSEFNKWWDDDRLTQTNPYPDDSPAFWAWEGWQAGVKAEREACADILDRNADRCDPYSVAFDVLDSSAKAIRARSNK